MRSASLSATLEAPEPSLTSAVSFEAGLRALLIMNLLDAVFTLVWIYRDMAIEANPLMQDAMAHGPGVFILLKVALVGLATYVLWGRREHRTARLAIVPAVTLYAYVFGGHLGFLVGNLLDVIPAVM